MVVINRLNTVTDRGGFNDIAGSAVGTVEARRNRQGARALLRAAAKIKMAYHSAGVPDVNGHVVGSVCVDTTNNDIYVLTDRSTPTWTKLSE